MAGKEASDVGMPPIKFTDGAVGAGGAASGTTPATAMPAATALAANFDAATARSYGAVVGREVKHRGFDGDWGPTVNIMRTPLGGRTFEAYGEDPFLSGQTAVGWIALAPRPSAALRALTSGYQALRRLLPEEKDAFFLALRYAAVREGARRLSTGRAGALDALRAVEAVGEPEARAAAG